MWTRTTVELLKEARREIASQPRRGLGLCALAALVMFSYGLARPAVDSLFLEGYGREGLPWVWLVVGAGALLATGVYAHYARTVPITRLMASVALWSAVVLAGTLGLELVEVPHSEFVLYVWKDVYIVVLVEVFWTFANVVHSLKSAKWTYGLFLVSGTLGSLAGELAVGPLAEAVGTRGAVAPVFGVLIAVALAARAFSSPAVAGSQREGVFLELGRGIAAIWRSRYLGLLVFLIGAAQVVITLIDYEFNGAMEVAYPELDERTAVFGRIYAVISAVSLILQGLAGPLFAAAGIPLVLVAIPCVLAICLGGVASIGGLVTNAVAKVASKSLDYSVGRAVKELLYIPLSYREKTQAKAFIDVFLYRMAKGGASVLLVWLIAFEHGEEWVVWMALGFVVVWFVVSHAIGRRFVEAGQSASREYADLQN